MPEVEDPMIASRVAECLVLASAVAIGATQSQGREHVLDFLGTTPMEKVDRDLGGRRLSMQQPTAVAPHGNRQDPGIAVLRPELDRGAYTWGDPFVVEWTIENRGTQPLKFPTRMDQGQVSTAMPGAVLVVVALNFQNEGLTNEIVGVLPLVGADSLPGSLLVVQPGERIRIRAPGKWRLGGAAKLPIPAGPNVYHVRSRIHHVYPGGVDWVAHSEAAASVYLTK
jgi:hypothetical protein